MIRNDDPPEEESAYEVHFGHFWFALDEDSNLYVYAPEKATRDDGYFLVGKFEGDEDDEEGFKKYLAEVVMALIEEKEKAPSSCH